MKLDLRVIVETLTVEPFRLPSLDTNAERDGLPPPFDQSQHVRIQGRIVGAGGLASGRLDLRTTDVATVKAVTDAARSAAGLPLTVTPLVLSA